MKDEKEKESLRRKNGGKAGWKDRTLEGGGQSKCGVSESMYEVEKEKGKANRMMEARERERMRN